jgi:hypothetical protein
MECNTGLKANETRYFVPSITGIILFRNFVPQDRFIQIEESKGMVRFNEAKKPPLVFITKKGS